MTPGLKVQPEQGIIILSGTTLVAEGHRADLKSWRTFQVGKNHESVMLLTANDPLAIRTAFVGFLGLQRDGQPAPQDRGLPARGWPVSVTARWQPDAQLDPDKWVETPLSSLVRNRLTDKVYPALPYVYTGSRFIQTSHGVVLGMAQTKSLIVNYDEADTLLASPFPMAVHDYVFEVNSAHAPLTDTPIEYVFKRAELPLTITQSASGALFHDGAELTDEQIGELLSTHYSTEAAPNLYAVGIAVRAEDNREIDEQTRSRILKIAASAGIWVVPVFTLGG